VEVRVLPPQLDKFKFAMVFRIGVPDVRALGALVTVSGVRPVVEDGRRLVEPLVPPLQVLLRHREVHVADVVERELRITRGLGHVARHRASEAVHRTVG
jgi:hypothetical protein